MSLTNEQKAARLEDLAKRKDLQGAHWKERSNACQSHPREKEGAMSHADDAFADAAFLREAAEMMRERGTVEWDTEGGATKNGLYLWAGAVCNGFASMVCKGKRRLYMDWHPNLEAAQAAAVAWVDEEEGEYA